MYPLRMESCLLLGAALLAGCSERNTPTAPSADAVALASRPYTWNLKCIGDFGSWARWWWTVGGTAVTDTTVGCSSGQTVSGSGVRPVSADGFMASVNCCNPTTWTFDAAGPFKAQLKRICLFVELQRPALQHRLPLWESSRLVQTDCHGHAAGRQLGSLDFKPSAI